jgi:hypothetical protein
MRRRLSISPTAVRDFAKARGWKVLDEGLRHRLFVMSNPEWEHTQLVFPIDDTAPDLSEAVWEVARKLSEFSGESIETILNGMQQTWSDVLRFAIVSGRPNDQGIPLEFAASVLDGAQQLISSATHTALKPQLHHPRLSRSEAETVLKKSEFQQTEHGSFILKIACPVDAVENQGMLPLEGDDSSLVRRATVIIDTAISRIVEAIEKDAVENLVEEIKRETAPLISANLCEALTQFNDRDLENSLDFAVDWASSRPRRGSRPRSPVVRLQPNYFRFVSEIADALRALSEDEEDSFVGTVEKLHGEVGEDGRRAGEVILNLFHPETNEIVRARAILNADQYDLAIQAHRESRNLIETTGKLSSGRQPRQLSNISQFLLKRVGPAVSSNH